METPTKPQLTAALTLFFAVFITACAHVQRDDYDADMAAVRAELAQLDERSARAEQTDTRNAAQTAALSTRMDGLTEALSILELEFDVAVEVFASAIRFHVPVYFGFGRDDLRMEDLPVLARFGEVVGEFYPDVLVTVEGFTDPAGTSEYNLALGQRRAEAVRAYLIETEGFSDERVRAVSYGEDPKRLVSPDAWGDNEGMENRRVALVIEHHGT